MVKFDGKLLWWSLKIGFESRLTPLAKYNSLKTNVGEVKDKDETCMQS